MKIRIFFLFLISLFVLSSCTKEIVTCKIISPKDGDTFFENQTIEVKVEASTTKGSMMQVQLILDNQSFDSQTKDTTSYTFLIPGDTLEPGLRYITAVAYNTNQTQESSSILVTIDSIPVPFRDF